MSDEMHGCPCCGGGFAHLLGVEGIGFAADNVVALPASATALWTRRSAISAAALAAATLPFGCAAPKWGGPPLPTGPVTRIYTGGSVLTMDAQFSVAEAIALSGDRIVAVGSRDEIGALAGPETEVIDLKGRALLPGFIDPHTHIVIGSLLDQTMEYVGMTRFATRDAVLSHLKGLADAAAPGAWIVARNYTPMLQGDGAALLRDDLDAIAPDNPVAVMNASGHILYVNSHAYAAAGIEEDIADPQGGRYGRDDAGRLNGEIFNGAVYMRVLNTWGGITASSPVEAILQTCKDFSRFGLTTVSELALGSMTQGAGDLGLLQQAANSGRLAQRLRAYCLYSFAEAFDTAGITMGSGDALVRVAGTKLIADGSNQGFTGLQREPYLDRAETGIAYMTPEQLRSVMRDRLSKDWRLAIHGNGDKAIDNILDALETVAAEGVDVTGSRIRIEHCSILHDEQIARMKALGVSASFLIPHVYYWGVAMRDKIFGPDKAALLDRCASCEQAGVGFSVHSDFFVTDPDPLRHLDIAMTRRTWKEPDFALAPEEAVSLETALRAITSEAAWQLGSEHEIGSLEPGKLADFVILEADPRAVAPGQLHTIKVLETWMGGVQQYAA